MKCAFFNNLLNNARERSSEPLFVVTSSNAEPSDGAFGAPGEIVQEIESVVAGIQFHRGNVDGILNGIPMILDREPTNAFDPNAIRVNFLSGETLGYLPKKLSAQLATQIDAGTYVRVSFSRVEQDKGYVMIVIGMNAS